MILEEVLNATVLQDTLAENVQVRFSHMSTLIFAKVSFAENDDI